MTASSLPALQAMRIESTVQGPCLLLKLSSPAPPQCALAVVLDMSDSCPAMREEIERLPRLFERLPLSWPLWLYRLSDPQALDGARPHTLAHLCDGSLQLTFWLENQSLRQRAAGSGSLIRPVLQAIESRVRDQRLDGARAIVLTDGELLDAAPVSGAPGIEIIGLTSHLGAEATRHWRRVLPRSPLFTLSDPALDRAFSSDGSAFYGQSEIRIELPTGRRFELARIDQATGGIEVQTEPRIDWNFVDGALYLLVSPPPDHQQPVRAYVTAARNNAMVSLEAMPSQAFGNVPPAILAALAKPRASSINIILDIDSTNSGFAKALESLEKIATLTQARSPWTDGAGEPIVFQADCFRELVLQSDGKIRGDAWLCLSNVVKLNTHNPSGRIVLVALVRHARPALQWHAGDSLPFGTSTQSVHIEFDKMEGRWMVVVDGAAPRELDPRGSEAISLLFQGDVAAPNWAGYFSGSLK